MRKFVLDIQALALRNEIEIYGNLSSTEHGKIYRYFTYHPLQNMWIISNKKGKQISCILSGIIQPRIIDWDTHKNIDLTWKEYYAIVKYANTKILDNNDIADGYAKLLLESEEKIMKKVK